MINREEFKNQNRESLGLKMSNPDAIEDTRPSILLIGINAPTYSAKGILNGITECGYRAEFLDWQHLKMDVGIDGLGERAIRKAQMTAPELIICHIQNPEGMYPETYIALQEIAPVVNLNFDCRNDVKWMTDLAPLISLTCFSNQQDVDTCEKKGIRNTVSLHSSCNYDFYKPKELSFNVIPQPQYKLPEIAFIGGNYFGSNVDFPLAKQRQEMIDFLYHIYPNQFMAVGMGQKVSRYVNEFEELAIYHGAKIIIGHNNFEREKYSSDRMFRAMGSGAFYVSPWFPGIEEDFSKEINIEWWDSFQNLKDIIDYYLSSEEERKSIAVAGCNLVRSKHRWKDRIASIINVLQSNGNLEKR